MNEPTPPTIDVDIVAAAYRTAKRAKDDLDAKSKLIAADLAELKSLLLNHMTNNKLTSLTTAAGDKMHTRGTTRYSSGDWSAFKAWVVSNPDAIDLFEHRLHQGNTAIWLKDNEGDTSMVPPGLSAHTTTAIVVTPTKQDLSHD